MLKRDYEVTAGSLSSCRIKAESLARAFNSRIWPSTCVDRGVAGDIPNGDTMRGEEDEEFFDASPSPVEDDCLYCQRDDCSAATIAGRAKLYELLQQHALDDATDVFYDVSENAESLTANVCENGEGNSNVNGCSDDTTNIDECQSIHNHSEQSLNSSDDTIRVHVKSSSKECICDLLEQNSIQNPERENNFCDGTQEGNQDLSSLNPEIDDNIENTLSLRVRNSICLYKELNHCKDEQNESGCLSRINAGEVYSSSSLTDHKNVNGWDLKTDNEDENADVSPDSRVQQDLSVYVTKDKDSEEKLNENCELLKEDDSTLHEPRRLQVFDKDRPLISRSTSLKTGKTPPGTPSRKKIVRFADVLGLDLEDVRHIISGDLPNIPQSAYNDLKLADEDLPSNTSAATIELKENQQGTWGSNQVAIGPNVLCPAFLIPGQQPGFWEKVRTLGICLESVTISDFSIHCTCRVMNWGYNKKVMARYTLDSWTTSSDIDASYVPGSTQNETDGFTFNIFLSPSYKNVEFALRYEVNGEEFWDNNGGSNYALNCHGNTDNIHSSIPSSPSWVHQFW